MNTAMQQLSLWHISSRYITIVTNYRDFLGIVLKAGYK